MRKSNGSNIGNNLLPMHQMTAQVALREQLDQRGFLGGGGGGGGQYCEASNKPG